MLNRSALPTRAKVFLQGFEGKTGRELTGGSRGQGKICSQCISTGGIPAYPYSTELAMLVKSAAAVLISQALNGCFQVLKLPVWRSRNKGSRTHEGQGLFPERKCSSSLERSSCCIKAGQSMLSFLADRESTSVSFLATRQENVIQAERFTLHASVCSGKRDRIPFHTAR